MPKGQASRRRSTGRFLLWMDMEGISQVVDYRECLPVFPEYWRKGRDKITADAIASASGLIKGGAGEVVVIDGHGLGWPNLLEEQLPKGVRPMGQADRFEDFDGMLLAGFHARCGTHDGFMSHTFVPYLRMAIDDSLVTECHAWALRSRVPVLGVIGDNALGDQLDGVLEGTPFLEVKASSTRTQTRPVHRSPKESVEAISKFAEECARDVARKKPAKAPDQFKLSFSMPSELAKFAAGRGRFLLESPHVVALRSKDWRRDADSATDVAMGIAANPLLQVISKMDFSSEENTNSAGTDRLNEARSYLVDWLEHDYPEWEK